MTCNRISLLGIMALFLASTAVATPSREPAVAGSFYPAERQALQEMVDGFLAKAANPPAEGELVALVAPHAGYVYSGAAAAHTYQRLRGTTVRRVILIGPAHRVPIRGAAIYSRGSWRTPLGKVPIDERLATGLIDHNAGVIDDPVPFAEEHSLEVQLPFLQRVLGSFTIIPILVGNPTPATMASLSARIALLLRTEPGTMLVCSTDLSHYHDAATAHAKDNLVIDAVKRMALGDLESLLRTEQGEACGGWPLLLTMAAARGAGATNGTLYRYADSGETGGDNRRVVGYAAMGLYRTPLTAEHGKELLRIARQTVTDHVNKRPLPELACNDPRLAADGAAFVTLKGKDGELRGCIGAIQPVEALCRSVRNNAVAAASRDYRFSPVHPRELAGLDLEITVLSPLEPVTDLSEIRLGTHGVYLQGKGTSSVFLPQVAPEQGWDLTTTLQQLARKAGLPADGWKNGQLFRFTAEIVHDETARR